MDSSFDATETIEKLLRRAERGIVQFLDAIQQAKTYAELRMQRLGVVTNNLKAAAFRGALCSERADEHMATRFHGARHLANVRNTLVHPRKEMKHGAVVPHIIGVGRDFDVDNVRCDPLNSFRGRTQTLFGYVDGSGHTRFS